MAVFSLPHRSAANVERVHHSSWPDRTFLQKMLTSTICGSHACVHSVKGALNRLYLSAEAKCSTGPISPKGEKTGNDNYVDIHAHAKVRGLDDGYSSIYAFPIGHVT